MSIKEVVQVSIAGGLLSSARRYKDVSGRKLARDTASSQAGLVELERGAKDATTDRLDKILRALNYQIAVLPTRLGTAAAAAETIRQYLERGNQDAALRVVLQFAADVETADPALRVALCVTPPAPTGESRYDALLAGLVDHSLSKDGLPLPLWVAEGNRRLESPWDIEPVPSLQPAARERTPEGFLRHGVYLDPAELVNA